MKRYSLGFVQALHFSVLVPPSGSVNTCMCACECKYKCNTHIKEARGGRQLL